MKNLNPNELTVLKAIAIGHRNAGGDFTYFYQVFEELKKMGSELAQNQAKGYLSQLVQKGYICEIDPEWEQINMTEKCIELEGMEGLLDQYNVELY
jgi:hypothetical protein